MGTNKHTHNIIDVVLKNKDNLTTTEYLIARILGQKQPII